MSLSTTRSSKTLDETIDPNFIDHRIQRDIALFIDGKDLCQYDPRAFLATTRSIDGAWMSTILVLLAIAWRAWTRICCLTLVAQSQRLHECSPMGTADSKSDPTNPEAMEE